MSAGRVIEGADQAMVAILVFDDLDRRIQMESLPVKCIKATKGACVATRRGSRLNDSEKEEEEKKKRKMMSTPYQWAVLTMYLLGKVDTGCTAGSSPPIFVGSCGCFRICVFGAGGSMHAGKQARERKQNHKKGTNARK
ncbi:uncharacterized protein CIMG_13320 [Coccidioides immitis RS]|uniref:Uncharacterized protein n=1 Tax=Coccidioides immitis (strain RS) TaxID=246410 RepID=A0A0D8JUU6_COCIM|nr:uncharacterized protein CIMG_13320 [Coccidioides immitis RS]KJF60919.1 hypothetical protein CIMG_13320 [Coccidioides immitis RS]